VVRPSFAALLASEMSKWSKSLAIFLFYFVEQPSWPTARFGLATCSI
jgi:hypothetical protein